jgi:hypothetical protein
MLTIVFVAACVWVIVVPAVVVGLAEFGSRRRARTRSARRSPGVVVSLRRLGSDVPSRAARP